MHVRIFCIHTMHTEGVRRIAMDEMHWIPVSLRKPEKYQTVYGYDNRKNDRYGSGVDSPPDDEWRYSLGGYCDDNPDGSCESTDGEYFADFTHWMPLPKPPKAGE